MRRKAVIGSGELWHTPARRRRLLALSALGLWPVALCALADAQRWPLSGFYLWGALPWLVAFGLLWLATAKTDPLLARRVSLGALGGAAAGVGVEAAFLLLGGGWDVGVGAGPAWHGDALRWVVWGLGGGAAYGAIFGRAPWGYGLIWGAGAAFGAWLGVGLGLGGHGYWPAAAEAARWSGYLLATGAGLGLFCRRFQPDASRTAKIIFLRDYQPTLTRGGKR